MLDTDVSSVLAGAATVFAQARALFLATVEEGDAQPPSPHCLAVVFTSEQLRLRMLFGRDGGNYRRLTMHGCAAFAAGDFERVEGYVYGRGRVADIGDAAPLLPVLQGKYGWLDARTVSGEPRCIELLPDRLTWVRLEPAGIIHETTLVRETAAWVVQGRRVKAPR